MTPAGRRDFAILLLLTRLGLRGGEVAALLFDDVDWRTGEIVIRGKGSATERLPLPRPSSTRSLTYPALEATPRPLVKPPCSCLPRPGQADEGRPR